MKKIIYIPLIALAFVACTAEETIDTTFVDANAAPVVELAEGTTETGMLVADVSIEGMSCEMGCVGAIKNQLGKMEGVELIDFPEFDGENTVNHAMISYNADVISGEELAAAIGHVNDGAYKVDKVLVGATPATTSGADNGAPASQTTPTPADVEEGNTNSGSVVEPTSGISLPSIIDLVSGIFSSLS